MMGHSFMEKNWINIYYYDNQTNIYYDVDWMNILNNNDGTIFHKFRWIFCIMVVGNPLQNFTI